ncbi:hemolysin secretion protein D, chromosomal [Clostridium homopropionicum DSM 5847]|uniref:Hemolysin secretion protein D, chromosomal n=1 Tax=Clostridium homopropionicum DSM 5847 TaxID=1121318 RepID=A0A0L6Z7Y2_9CLOT|nr:HlyD family efflux transporter periplasmic adaptor subunit [Clostridium homopropionicum]KOA19069.1 hemolysin secretion protein D, chromosomal [Clostridium homopropionicum DSM 5847]SFG97383.1 HlyD family secretion protein [Clostridium homopropionicum]
MREIVQNLGDITDSREILEARPYRFTSIFAYILIAILSIAIIWSYFGKIDIVVKSKGSVRPNEKISSIVNKVGGNVSASYLEEGKKVSKGDILYTIDYGNLNVEKNTLDTEFSKLNTELKNLEKFKQSIFDKKNLFNLELQEEKEFYYKYKKFEIDSKKISLESMQTELQLKQSKNEKSLNAKNLESQINKAEESINKLTKLKEAINKNVNTFLGQDSLFSNRYDDYKISIQKIQNDIEQRKIALENVKEKEKQSAVDVQNELDDANVSLMLSKLELEKYKNQYMINIQNTINENSANLAELSINSGEVSRKISTANDNIANFNLLIRSVKENNNLFSTQNDKYYNQYVSYSYNLDKLKKVEEQAKREFDNATSSYSSTNATSKDNAVQSALLQLEQYKNQYLISVEKSIEEATAALNVLNNTAGASANDIQKAEENLDNLNILKQCAIQNTNLFGNNDSIYAKQYLDYKYNVDIYQKKLDAAILDKNYSTNSDTIVVVNNKLYAYQNAQTDVLKYKNDYLLNLYESVKDNEDLIRQLQATSNSSSSKINYVSNTIYNLRNLEKSINENTNLFTAQNSEYYYKFIDYQNNIRKLDAAINQGESLVKKLIDKRNTVITNIQREIKSTQLLLEIAEIELQKYTNSGDLNINKEIDESKKSLENLYFNLEKNKYDPEMNALALELSNITLSKYETDNIVQLDENIKANKEKVSEIEKNLKVANLNLEDCVVRAPIDGTIHIINEINVAELLQPGTQIATIVPEDNSQFKVQLYLSNKDIASIKLGDSVKYHFEALPYKEYGELSGVITKIGTDSRVDQQSGISYYLVESEIENRPLYSYKGEKGELKIGMNCEAQVITKRKKILYYLLEKINLKD